MAAEAPPRNVAGALDRPQATLPAVGDEDHENLVTGHTLHDYPDPIDHGHGVEVVLEDKADGPHEEMFYTRVWRGWGDFVGDRDAEPYVLVEDVHQLFDWLHDDYPAHLVLKSKGWMVGRDAQDGELVGQYYEYSVQVMRYAEDSGKLADEIDANLRAPTSFQCWIQPQNSDLVLPSGDSMVCQHGEGTKFKTQTTYAGSRESFTRTVEVMNLVAGALDIERPAWETMNRGSWKAWKGEVHHRFTKSKMQTAVHRLQEAKSLLEYGGGGDVHSSGKMRKGRHVEEYVVSDRWEKLGIAIPESLDDAKFGVKVYRINGNPADKRLQEPKLEAFLAGSGDELPHADDWPMIRSVLRQLVDTFAVRSNLNLGDLKEDDYYKPRDRPMLDFYLPEGWRHAVQEANEARLMKMTDVVRAAQTSSKLDIVWTVADRNGASYDELAAVTGLSKDRVQEIVAEFVDQDVLLRLAMPRIIAFDNEELRLNVLDELEARFPDDADPRAIEKRADERRERRRRLREKRQQQEESDDAVDEDTEDGNTVDDFDQDDRDESDLEDEWQRVDLLQYCREDVGRFIERGDIPARDVKVRVSAHRWLIPHG